MPNFRGGVMLKLCGRVLTEVDGHAVLLDLGGRSGGLLDLCVRVLPSSDLNVLLHCVSHVLLIPLPGLNGLILQLSHEKLVLLLNPDRIFAFLCAFDLYLALGLHHFLTCHLG